MKKKFILTACVLAVAALSASAQNAKDKNDDRSSSGLALAIGGSASYYYGPGSRNFGEFENERVNWQLNGMLGITITRGKSGRRTMLAGFGAYGFNNRNTISQTFADQNYTTLELEQSSSNNFYQYEGGLLIADVLRLSTGMGQQNFDEQTLAKTDLSTVKLNAKYLKYYSSTVGLNLNLGNVTWVINCNFAYGKDYEQTVLTPSTGLMLRF